MNYLQVLLVFAIIAILAAVASPFYLQFQSRQQLQAAAQTLLSDVRVTQAKAMERYQNTSWGIRLEDSNKQYVVFSDANNFTIPYANSITISSPDQDVQFSAVTGEPSNGSTTITISSSWLPDEPYTITINEAGNTELN
ncbi:MAG: GspH/FimT family protein [Candidatus Kerfeldbacteria bacterium]|nr:GspH/FimT family protein [Candidatus Kerfeldbacteria bacterium]